MTSLPPETVFKLVLTADGTIILLPYTQPLAELADLATHATGSRGGLTLDQRKLLDTPTVIVHTAAALVLLLMTIVQATYKPAGDSVSAPALERPARPAGSDGRVPRLVTMTDPRAGGARASLARALVLAGALAGLFAMHGLSDHGATHPMIGHAGAHAKAAMTHAATGLGDLQHFVTDSREVAATHLGTASATASSAAASAAHAAGGAGDAGMMALCFAVLASAFVALARLRAAGELLPWFEGAALTDVALVATGRERDPPSLVALSISRC